MTLSNLDVCLGKGAASSGWHALVVVVAIVEISASIWSPSDDDLATNKQYSTKLNRHSQEQENKRTICVRQWTEATTYQQSWTNDTINTCTSLSGTWTLIKATPARCNKRSTTEKERKSHGHAHRKIHFHFQNQRQLMTQSNKRRRRKLALKPSLI